MQENNGGGNTQVLMPLDTEKLITVFLRNKTMKRSAFLLFGLFWTI
jgi:hypothetical protein